MELRIEEIIKRPILLTEKAERIREDHNQVVFEVNCSANKIQIKNAVEQLFQVNVLKVRTSIVRGKVRRMGRTHGKRHNWKKAVVTLKEGDDIQFYDEEAE